jgi:hypothetical protein
MPFIIFIHYLTKQKQRTYKLKIELVLALAHCKDHKKQQRNEPAMTTRPRDLYPSMSRRSKKEIIGLSHRNRGCRSYRVNVYVFLECCKVD